MPMSFFTWAISPSRYRRLDVSFFRSRQCEAVIGNCASLPWAMVVPTYADRKDIIDVNIVAVSGNRIGVYDKALPVKVVQE
jgi:hypothetical protein